MRSWQRGDGSVSASFRSYRVKAGEWPQAVKRLFAPAAEVPSPFRPFLTQYDTYLMKYESVKQ